MAVEFPGRKFPSYLRTKKEELVQDTPAVPGNNFQAQFTVGGCLQERIGASNIQCKGHGLGYVIGASFKGINKQKPLCVLMQKNKTPDCLFAPEFDAGLRAIFNFHPLPLLCSMSFKFIRSLSALPYAVNIGALSVDICM